MLLHFIVAMMALGLAVAHSAIDQGVDSKLLESSDTACRNYKCGGFIGKACPRECGRCVTERYCNDCEGYCGGSIQYAPS